MPAYEPFSTYVCACWINGLLRDDPRHGQFVRTFKQEYVDKIRRAPTLQFSKALGLTPVMWNAPASRVRWLVWSLQFNEGACRGARSHERDIWPSNPWIDKFRNYGEPRSNRDFGQNGNKQFLECRCKSGFLHCSMRTAQIANTLRIVKEVVNDWHAGGCTLLVEETSFWSSGQVPVKIRYYPGR